MTSSFPRILVALLVTIFLLSPSSSAFETPLSEEAVREAYFLGQRRDETLARFLDKYTRHLAPPESGPYIASVTFLTPFALAAQLSSRRSAGYSAQQAQIDHRKHKEIVRIVVQIDLTESYGPFVSQPADSRSGSATSYVLRPYDFWKDFDVRAFSSEKTLIPIRSWGEPNESCSPEGGCILTGATLYLDFPADAFASDSAAVGVIPPEGDPVSVDFDLSALR